MTSIVGRESADRVDPHLPIAHEFDRYVEVEQRWRLTLAYGWAIRRSWAHSSARLPILRSRGVNNLLASYRFSQFSSVFTNQFSRFHGFARGVTHIHVFDLRPPSMCVHTVGCVKTMKTENHGHLRSFPLGKSLPSAITASPRTIRAFTYLRVSRFLR